jgi:hypothetical protein
MFSKRAYSPLGERTTISSYWGKILRPFLKPAHVSLLQSLFHPFALGYPERAALHFATIAGAIEKLTERVRLHEHECLSCMQPEDGTQLEMGDAKPSETRVDIRGPKGAASGTDSASAKADGTPAQLMKGEPAPKVATLWISIRSFLVGSSSKVPRAVRKANGFHAKFNHCT